MQTPKAPIQTMAAVQHATVILSVRCSAALWCTVQLMKGARTRVCVCVCVCVVIYVVITYFIKV